MGRRPCCAKEGLNRGSWSVWEDRILSNYVHLHGEGKWRDLPQKAGLKRCGKSCRLRWLNYLRPNIKRGNISSEEEELIIRLHKLLGNRWSLIAGRLPGRTDNEIKNYWNTNLSKRLHASKIQNPTGHRNKTSSPESPHPVIRTKAVRCTKVLIPPPPPPLRNPSPDFAAPAAAPSIVCEPADCFMDIDIADLLTCDAFLEYEEGTRGDNNGAADNFPICNDFLVPGIEDRDGGMELNTLTSFLNSEYVDQWISDNNNNNNHVS